MTDKQLVLMAQEAGFKAAVIPTNDVVVNYDFRTFCEENRCGKYGANYSCPPDCGTPQQVHDILLSKDTALVLQMICDIDGYDDIQAVQAARSSLNHAVLKVFDTLVAEGYSAIPLGYNGCPLCNPCRRTLGQPCAFPDRKISCLSAYCVDVTQLAKRCSMEFTWSDKKLYLFGMIIFDKKPEDAEKGQIHVYTGDGKGKTTAALGLAVRAAGADKKVYIGQFIKDMEYHEVKVLRSVGVTVELYGSGDGCFINRAPQQNDVQAAEAAVQRAKQAAACGEYDVVILDEINIAHTLKLITTQQMLDIMDSKADRTELVFTGRYCPQQVLDKADLVTEMKEVRHYYNTKGLLSRDGIER